MDKRAIEGRLSAAGRSFAVVVARWNSIFSERLLDGAVDTLVRHGASMSDISVVRVPGSFEIPVVVSEIAKSGTTDAVVALGVLIRGETDHYDLIAKEVTAALSRVSIETGVPVGFGVVTADSMDQAMARAGAKAGNKGSEAALASIEMIGVMDQLRKPAK